MNGWEAFTVAVNVVLWCLIVAGPFVALGKMKCVFGGNRSVLLIQLRKQMQWAMRITSLILVICAVLFCVWMVGSVGWGWWWMVMLFTMFVVWVILLLWERRKVLKDRGDWVVKYKVR